MKRNIAIIFFTLMTFVAHSQTLKNTSYLNQSGERVLRLELILPANIIIAWTLFAADEKLKKWIAPLAHSGLSFTIWILYFLSIKMP